VGGGVSRPEIISSTPPVYTMLARLNKVTGTVILEATIDEHGNVTEARVLKGLPMGLDRAAVEAVKTWKFAPAVLHGQPVPVYYVLTINFRVDKGDASDYGPRFARFLTANPQFASVLHAKRYQDAAALLDRWAAEMPDNSEIPLARIYLLLDQGRFKEGWQAAVRYRGPDPQEALHAVGVAAWEQMSSGKVIPPETYAELLELGLQAETAAMAAKADALEPLVYKGWLLREKAKLTSDPQQSQALVDEADQLQQKAEELQFKRE